MSTKKIEMRSYGALLAGMGSFGQHVGSIDRLRCVVGGIVERMHAYYSLKRAERQLRSLDDRVLQDIGLDRSEIGSVLTDRLRERIRGSNKLEGPYC